MQESWRIIVDFPKYEISESGAIRTINGKKIKSTIINNCGYVIVVLYKNNKQHAKRVHRLVGKAYIPNPKLYPEINHKDGDKLNNHKDNLEWVTKPMNYKHSIDNGLRRPLHTCARRGQYRLSHRTSKK